MGYFSGYLLGFAVCKDYLKYRPTAWWLGGLGSESTRWRLHNKVRGGGCGWEGGGGRGVCVRVKGAEVG